MAALIMSNTISFDLFAMIMFRYVFKVIESYLFQLIQLTRRRHLTPLA